MRPIRLKLKGLNSFLNAQEIDFEELTSQGLFGIFGPTGSGKSTILDGITMALYGTTARNSGNFIHVGAERAVIEYVFSVREKTERVYSVSRSFRRSKEGSIRSEGAKFLELTAGKETVLADRVGAVNEKCREVIGLSKEDFFRTVVLPQGKFSEFLKLEGMEKNKMLERLFHLEKYGEAMSLKLKEQTGIWNAKKQEREGALSQHQRVSREELRESRRRETAWEARIQEIELERKRDAEKLKEAQECLRLLQEQERVLEQEKTLNGQKEQIEALKEELQKAEAAGLLSETLEAFQRAEGEEQKRKEEARKAAALWEEQAELLKEAEEKKKRTEERYQEEKPRLEIQRVRLEECLPLLEKKKRLALEKQEAQEKFKVLSLELTADLEKQERLLRDIDNLEKSRQKAAQDLEGLKVSREEQEMLEEGVKLLEELERLSASRKNLQEKLEGLIGRRVKKERELQEKRLLEQEVFQKEEEGKARLLKEKERLSSLEISQKEREFLEKALTEREKDALLEQEESVLEKSCEELELQLKEAREEERDAEKLREKEEAFYRQNLAAYLRASLREGEPCPVCGGRSHLLPSSPGDETSLKEWEKRQKKAAEALQNAKDRVIRLEERLLAESRQREEKTSQRQALDPVYKNADTKTLKKTLEEREKERLSLEKSISQREEELQRLAKEKNALMVERTRLEAEEQAERERLLETRKEEELLKEKLDDQKKQYRQTSGDLEPHILLEKYRELQEKRSKSEELRGCLDQTGKSLEDRRQNRDKEQNSIQEKQGRQTVLEFLLRQQEEEEKRLDGEILDRAGEEKEEKGLKERLESLKTALSLLENSKKQTEELWEKAKAEEADRKREQFTKQALAKAALLERKEKQKRLEEKQKEYGIESAEWISRFYKTKEEREDMKEALDCYFEKQVQIRTQKERLQRELRDRWVTAREVLELEQKVQSLEEEFREAGKALGAAKKELEQLENAWKEKESIQKELEQICHKLDLLSELEGLFRGKRFVEYVSRYYLEYISREADQRLKEMTGNGYGLETDGNGVFVIRDYKNGGVLRPASTLSGGETFMASLALALSLSSQIQMKGSAPMELFFLDEGFGTLDETCLDIVMTALEKIRGRKRSVGVISHVEEIKARMPARLMVEPGGPGEGGSRVRIEKD